MIGFFLYAGLERQIADRHQADLNGMTELVLYVIDRIPSFDALAADPKLVAHLLVGHDNLKLWIYVEGRTLFSSSVPELPKEAWADMTVPFRHPSESRLWQDNTGRLHRFTTAGYQSDRLGPGNAVIVLALDISDEQKIVRSFGRRLMAAIAVGLLIAAALGFFITRYGLGPLIRIAQRARLITVSQLHERLDLRGAPHELTALAQSFNMMLARLEDSFRRLSDFSADLAHELRTPLTSLLGRSQVTLSHARSADEYREALESNIEDIEQLSKIVSDMLFLAHADRAEAALQREPFDLRAEADRVAEFFEMTADERGIGITVQGAATVYADRTMMRRALANLVSNAIRHSPEGGHVEVVIAREEANVTASVIDRGPGIPAEHQSRIFDRFYRADPSRTRHSGGTGLGLAIVRSIARLHGGDVSVTSDPHQRTMFTLALPATGADAERGSPEPARE